MTPWGIRKRVKSALGMGAPRSEDAKVSLTMQLPDGREQRVECETGYTLVMASQVLETPIATNCPDGHCGKCVVDVQDASGLKEPSAAEAALLKEPNTRLGCHAKVVGSGARVRVRSVWTMDSVKGA